MRFATMFGLSALVLLASAVAAGGDDGRKTAGESPETGDKRERACDRVVHIEEEIILEIPSVPPLCESLPHLVKRRVSVGDCELYCEQAGAGTAIVLISGGPGSTHHGFHPWFARAEEFATVVYYDQRGTGFSDATPGDGYSVYQSVADLDKLREALGHDQWIVLGHSYGGILAQLYTIAHPDRVKGLVLVGSSTGMDLNLDRRREYMFLSKEERRQINKIFDAPGLTGEQVVYNIDLNGSWKRQNYYKPSPEEMARTALYEWQPASGMRDGIQDSISMLDLRGVFADCPIPTLIMEGLWDLTWNTDKPGKFHKQHPKSKLVMFEESAHSPFADEPEKFFSVLRDFSNKCQKVDAVRLVAWKDYVAKWRKSAVQVIRKSGYGQAGSERIAKAFKPSWIDDLETTSMCRRVGDALYDCKRFSDALPFYRKAGELSEKTGVTNTLAMALIWQGHMYDLLGDRDRAKKMYQRVVEMNCNPPIHQDQYGLVYHPSEYARERLQTPFTWRANIWDDL